MNKNNKFTKLLTLTVLAIFLIGCASSSSKNNFNKYLPTNHVNIEIKLSVPDYQDQPQASYKDIELLMSNTSKDLIRFPIDFGIKLYEYNEQNGDWEEIENNTTYTVGAIDDDEEFALKQVEEEGGIPLYPKGSPFGQSSVRPISANPILTGQQNPAKVRVLVVGTIFRDNKPTNIKVAAYYDVMLNPEK